MSKIVEEKLNKILADSNAGTVKIDSETIVWEAPDKTRIFDDTFFDVNLERFFRSLGSNWLYYAFGS